MNGRELMALRLAETSEQLNRAIGRYSAERQKPLPRPYRLAYFAGLERELAALIRRMETQQIQMIRSRRKEPTRWD